MPQYGQGRLVYRCARTKSGQRQIHTTRHCPALRASHATNVLAKPLPSFPDHVPRCTECFPMSDDTADDKANAATHVNRAKDELEAAADHLDNAGQVKHIEDMADEAEKTAEVLEDQAESME